MNTRTLQKRITAELARLQRAVASGMRQRRENAGLTVAQAATRAELTPTRWQRLEDGTARADLNVLTKIANALECDPADLARG